MALDFAAGCLGGAAGVLVGYPLDTVKVRIQTQPVAGVSELKYTGTFQCLNKIVKTEGASALYRGMSSPLAGVAAINAIGFGVYGNVVRRLPDPDSITSVALAGSIAGCFQAFVCGPMEMVKTQMQVGGHNGPFNTISQIVKTCGLKGLTKGMGLTIAREVPGCGLYFGAYEVMVRGHEDNTLLVFAAGGAAGIISWIFTYPQDVIKSRIQGDLLGSEAKYKGALDCLRLSLQREGPKMLMRGIGSTIVRAFPTNAATMGTATMVMRTFSDDHKDIKVYDTMARLRTGAHLQITLPPSVERYFEKKKRFTYLNNFSTSLSPDNPAIVQIGRSTMAVSYSRLYVSNMLYAVPSRFYNRDAIEGNFEVGTIRANVSIFTLHRLIERTLKARRDKREELNFNSHEAFVIDVNGHLHGSQDFIIHGDQIMITSDPLTTAVVAASEGMADSESDGLQTPSLLTKDRGSVARKDTITTSDFLIQQNTASKIYGFYYLV